MILRLFRRSLMARLVGYFFFLSLVVVGIVGSLSYFRARQALTLSVYDRLSDIKALKSRDLIGWVGEETNDLRILASSRELRSQVESLIESNRSGGHQHAAYSALSKHMAALARFRNDFKQIFILNKIGGAGHLLDRQAPGRGISTRGPVFH